MILVARHALRESLRRRIFAVVLGLSIAFGALYAFGAHELFKDVSGFSDDSSGLDPKTLAGATILGLAMFGSLIRLSGAAVVTSALALLGSVFLTATANGIAVLMVYGAGLLAGLLGEIGDAIPSRSLQRIADVASWTLPFEELYRDALRELVGSAHGVTGAIIKLGPLGGSHDAGPLLIPWAIAYIALAMLLAGWAFMRRDV